MIPRYSTDFFCMILKELSFLYCRFHLLGGNNSSHFTGLQMKNYDDAEKLMYTLDANPSL